jgi:hypothetical protein
VLTIIPIALCILLGEVGSFTGTVVDQDNCPVPGAVVQVYTGVPKDGPALLCPSSYADCGKLCITQAEGKFLIESVDPTNQFTLVVGATGYRGTVTKVMDPTSKEPLAVRLQKHAEAPKNQIVRGRVVDLDGKAIAGAHIDVRHYKKGNRGSSSVSRMIDPLAITDANGDFQLISQEPLDGVMVRASLPGYAPSEGYWDFQKGNPITISLGLGARIQGTLVYGGQPMKNTKIGVVQRHRSIHDLITPVDVVTDVDGFFQFDRLPPAMEYILYTHVNQNAIAALAPTIIAAPQHGQTADFDRIEALKPVKLTAKLKTSDGSKFPPKSGLHLGSNEAWHGTTASLTETPECVIAINDLPKNSYRISFKVPGLDVHQLVPSLSPGLNRDYELTLLDDREILIIFKPNSNESETVAK